MLLHAANLSAAIDEMVKQIRDVPGMLQCRMCGTGPFHLHTALELLRSVRIICQLLKSGADPLARDNADQTPAGLAREKCQIVIVQLLDRAACGAHKQQIP